MQKELYTDGYQVICRIGSLEIAFCAADYRTGVICRIGSLEIETYLSIWKTGVICRIGSLETWAAELR